MNAHTHAHACSHPHASTTRPAPARSCLVAPPPRPVGARRICNARAACIRVRPAHAGDGRYFVRVGEGSNRERFEMDAAQAGAQDSDVTIDFAEGDGGAAGACPGRGPRHPARPTAHVAPLPAACRQHDGTATALHWECGWRGVWRAAGTVLLCSSLCAVPSSGHQAAAAHGPPGRRVMRPPPGMVLLLSAFICICRARPDLHARLHCSTTTTCPTGHAALAWLRTRPDCREAPPGGPDP